MKRLIVLLSLASLLIPGGGALCRAVGLCSAEAEARYRRGLRLKRAEAYDAALKEFEGAIARSPDYIAAHREYQNIMLDFGFQEELVRDYGARMREEPASAAAHYLYGRLLDDPAQQAGEFEKALRITPDFLWGHYGKAMIALRTGRNDLAKAELAKALAIEPSLLSARWAMGLVESAVGRHGTALWIFEKLLREDEYYREAYQSALSECVFLERWERGGIISERAVRLFPRSAAVLVYRGCFLSRAGKRKEAIESYEKALAIEPLPFIFMRDLRLLYVKEGMYKRAVDLWKDSFGVQIACGENRLLPLWRQLEGAVGNAEGGKDPARQGDLAKAFAAMGWWAEAAAIDGSGEMTGAAAAQLSNAGEGERLIALLSRYGKRLRTELAQKKNRISFSRAVAELKAATEKDLGRSLISPGAVCSAPGVRWFGENTGRPQPLLDILRGGNREIIFFENVFGRRINFEFGELLSCELRRSGGNEFGYWAATCCLSGDGVMEGESGLAYPPFTGYAIFYDATRWTPLCDVRRRQKRNPLESGWVLEEVGGARIGRGEVRYSRMLERRLFEKVCRDIERRGGGFIQERLEDLCAAIVAEHEYQHLVDLRRHLPVWNHPVSCLVLACRNLFLPSLIEACFEERAIFRSLARCPEPLLGLLALHAQLEGGGGPHLIASRHALSRIVKYIAAHPEIFPAIDCERNILNQLYLLSGEEVRGIAQEIYSAAFGRNQIGPTIPSPSDGRGQPAYRQAG